MNMKSGKVETALSLIFAVGGFASLYLAYTISNATSNLPSELLNKAKAAISNIGTTAAEYNIPVITQGFDYGITSGITSNPNLNSNTTSEYSSAPVYINPTQAQIQQIQNSGQSTLIVNTTTGSTGSVNYTIPTSVQQANASGASGSMGNPYYYTQGWQGIGYYWNLPSYPPNTVQYYPTQADYNTGQLGF
jgi:hypothetical protein